MLLSVNLVQPHSPTPNCLCCVMNIHVILFQLIIFMALADGVSKVLSGPLTMHTKTAIHIAEMLTKVC